MDWFDLYTVAIFISHLARVARLTGLPRAVALLWKVATDDLKGIAHRTPRVRVSVNNKRKKRTRKRLRIKIAITLR